MRVARIQNGSDEASQPLVGCQVKISQVKYENEDPPDMQRRAMGFRFCSLGQVEESMLSVAGSRRKVG